MGERGRNLPDAGFLQRQQKYYGAGQARFLRTYCDRQPSRIKTLTLLPLLPFSRALMNKNQVVSAINYFAEYVEQFT